MAVNGFDASHLHHSLLKITDPLDVERKSRGLDELPADPKTPPSISITYYRSDLVLNNNHPAATPAIEKPE
jgi:hypothetical protein